MSFWTNRPMTAPGMTVTAVFDGSAAAMAGIQAGDRLLTLDGRWTDSIADCYQAAEALKPGQAVEILLRRDVKEVKVIVTAAPGL